MSALFARTLSGTIEGAVRLVVLPIANVIPFLVRTGILLAVFAVLWLAFGAALVADRPALDAVWSRLTGLPLPLQGVAWLLFLPVVGGLWVWSTDWPEVVRLAIVIGLGAWNLLVFLPRPTESSTSRVDADHTSDPSPAPTGRGA